MNKTVTLAKQNNVLVGAHPSLPDRQGFGRREMAIEPVLTDSSKLRILVLTLYCLGRINFMFYLPSGCVEWIFETPWSSSEPCK